MRFVVTTRDVDGSTRRAYKSRKGAAARFESMVGYSMANAIDEHYHASEPAARPTPDTVARLQAVSMFGTAVFFRAED